MRYRLALAILCVAAPLSAATFTVTTTADAGAGSLRQAILDANANPGADLIRFNVGLVGGVRTIAPLSALPTITDAVTIDGTSPSFTAVTELRGDGAGPGVTGLTVTAPDCTIEGLIINRFGGRILARGSEGGGELGHRLVAVRRGLGQRLEHAALDVRRNRRPDHPDGAR